MPYRSEAQRRFFNSPGAAKAGITPAQVGEWNEASKGMALPERAKRTYGTDRTNRTATRGKKATKARRG